MNSWAYSIPHWIYVVLSRVTSLKSLVLNEKLDESKSYEPNAKVLKWEKFIKEKVEQKSFKDRGSQDYEQYLSEEETDCLSQVADDDSHLKSPEKNTKDIFHCPCHQKTFLLTPDLLAHNREVEYICNLNGNYFKFIDVPGDGDCFFHSVLKHSILSGKYDNVKEIRSYLKQVVEIRFETDIILQQIFIKSSEDCKLWCGRITTMGEWTTTFDQLVFSYCFKVNIISIGNYSNGFISNNMQNYLRTLLGTSTNISQNGHLHVFFHTYGSPLIGCINGNHYAYLQPITKPRSTIPNNTIKLL